MTRVSASQSYAWRCQDGKLIAIHMSSQPKFWEGLLAAIERHRITMLIVPPPVMGLLARHPRVDAFDLASVELIVSGKDPTVRQLLASDA